MSNKLEEKIIEIVDNYGSRYKELYQLTEDVAEQYCVWKKSEDFRSWVISFRPKPRAFIHFINNVYKP
jgi:hypothetical protein